MAFTWADEAQPDQSTGQGFQWADEAPQSPAQAPAASPASSDRIGGPWGSVLDYFDLQKQAQAPEQRSFGAKALTAAGVTAQGLVPHSFEQAAQLAEYPVKMLPSSQVYENAKRVYDYAQGKPALEAATQDIPIAQRVPQYLNAPDSQGRYNAVAGGLADASMFLPILHGEAPVPNVDAAVRESMAQKPLTNVPKSVESNLGGGLEGQVGSQPTQTEPAAQSSQREPPVAQTSERGPEDISSVAVRTPEGQVFAGSTHANAINDAGDAGIKIPFQDYEKGFVTNTGRFVNRDEALSLARANGRSLDKAAFSGGGLHSGSIEPLQPEPAAATIPETPDELSSSQAQAGQRDTAPRAEPEPAAVGGAGTGEGTEGGRPAGVSTQNEYTGGRREVLGMEPRDEVVRRSDESVQDAADALFRADPNAGQKIAERLNDRPGSEVPGLDKDVEQAALRTHVANLERQHAELVEHINKTGDQSAIERLNEVREERQVAFGAAEKSGTDLARGFRQRGVEAPEQYTLPRMEAETRAVNGGKPLSPVKLKEVQRYQSRIAELEARLAAREKAISEGRVNPRGRRGVVEFLDKQAEAARQRIIERRGRLNVGFDPTALSDEIIIGASHIARGIRNFDAWSARMLKDFGDRVKPYLRELYERAIQTRNEAAKSTKTSFKPTGSTAESVGQFKKLDTYKTATIAKTEAVKAKIAAKDVSPAPSRAELVLDEQAQKLRAEYEKAKYDYQVMLEKDRLANRPRLKKIIDTAVDLERAIKLTGIKTFGKLGGAGIQRVAQNIGEEAVGKALSLAPIMRKVMQAAPTEGAPTLGSTAAYVRGIGRGIKEIPGVVKGEIMARDVREGGTPKVPSVLDIPGRLHGAVKQPFKKAQESMALHKAIDTAIRQGKDINKPGVIEEAQARAKESGLRAIFTHDNVLSNAFNSFVTALEHNKKFPTAGYGAARLMRFLLPIVRVPTNIAIETATMSTGTLTGSAKLMQVMARGMETIKPEEADMIARHYKKGLVGAGLFLTGFFNPDNFGGFYQEPGKKKEKINRAGLGFDEARIGGVTIPKWFMHSPAALQMQFGATVRKYMDTGKSAPESAMTGAQEILHGIPFVSEMTEFDSLLKSNWEGQKSRGNLLKGSIVPQGVQNIAEWTDQGKKRSPHSMYDYIASGIPGLRQQVPLSRH
jgi:hypothetical protein